jgi:hypothetical protein
MHKTTNNSAKPMSLTVVFTSNSYTSRGVSGNMCVLAAYRMYGPVIGASPSSTTTVSTPLTTVNGLAVSNNTATTFTYTLANWLESPATDRFDMQLTAS